MNEDIDVFEDADLGSADESGLSRLRQLFDQHQKLAHEVDDLRAELSAKEADLRKIEEQDFPELFDEVGIQEFKANNRKVALKTKLYGSLPKDPVARTAALEALRRLDGAELIRNSISVDLAKGEDERVKVVVDALRQLDLAPNVKMDVNHSSLQAFGRKQIAAGKLEDPGLLGLYHRRFVEIK